MAKIRFLHPRRLKDKRFAWHWKPSPKWRALGWTNLELGITDRREPSAAIVAACQAQTERMESALGGPDTGPAASARPPRLWTFGDLVRHYRVSDRFRGLKAATRKEYDSRIGQLEFWAEDGALHLSAIDADTVADLKKALLANDGSVFKCAAMLRVLRILMRFAKSERLIAVDPTADVRIPTPPSRRMKLDWPSCRDLADAAEDPLVARALRIGFWSMQRRDDLRQFNRFHWQELHGADPRDLPALVNGKGQVMGFRLTPTKTLTTSGRSVDCPMPPWLHAEIEAAFERSQWLFPHPLDLSKPIPGHLLQRRVKAALREGGFPDHQLRDLRRSGMSGAVDLGAMKSDVFAISGHPLDGQQRTMADVYMPPDTRAACRAIAAPCRTLATIEAREKENEK